MTQLSIAMRSRCDLRLCKTYNSHNSSKRVERVAIRTVSVSALLPLSADDRSIGARSVVRNREVTIALTGTTYLG